MYSILTISNKPNTEKLTANLGSVREGRTQDKLLPPRLERRKVNTQRHGFLEQKLSGRQVCNC